VLSCPFVHAIVFLNIYRIRGTQKSVIVKNDLIAKMGKNYMGTKTKFDHDQNFVCMYTSPQNTDYIHYKTLQADGALSASIRHSCRQNTSL